MSATGASIDQQIRDNSDSWWNASAAGKIILHDQNVALQAQKDALNQTVTVYNPSVGTYHTQAAEPVRTWVDTPSTPTTTNYPVYATTASNAQVTQAPPQTDQAIRLAEASAFTGWDNDPTLRGIQVKAWDLYVASGSWTSAAQVKLHNDAEAIRKSMNISYDGMPWGTVNKAGADALILPDTQPLLSGVASSITNALKGVLGTVTGTTADSSGGMMPLVLGGGALLLVMSLFKGR